MQRGFVVAKLRSIPVSISKATSAMASKRAAALAKIIVASIVSAMCCVFMGRDTSGELTASSRRASQFVLVLALSLGTVSANTHFYRMPSSAPPLSARCAYRSQGIAARPSFVQGFDCPHLRLIAFLASATGEATQRLVARFKPA